MATANKILGINDEVTTCEDCGKKNLNRTVVILRSDGSVVHVGTSCAVKYLGMTKSHSNYNSISRIAKAVMYYKRWITVYPGNQSKILSNIRAHFAVADEAVLNNI